MTKNLILSSFFLSFFSILVQAQNLQQLQKIVPPDRKASDYFGNSLAISGNYAIVGANQQAYDANGGGVQMANAGAVYIYKFSNGTWALQQKLVAPDRAASDNFGIGVAIDGDYAIIGAYGQDYNANGTSLLNDAGAAYIFKLDNGSWIFQQKLVASDRAASDNFGRGVAINGDYAIVGADFQAYDVNGANKVSAAGAAYIFKLNGNTWLQQQKLVANDRKSSNYLGTSVAIDGDYAVVGAYGQKYDANGGGSEINAAGAAYIFKRNGTSWAQQQKLVAFDRGEHNYFGRQIAINSGYIIVGARGQANDANGGGTKMDRAGAAYIYKLNGSIWALQQKLVAADRTTDDFFGGSVDIDGNYAIVGAYGQKYYANGGSEINYSAGAAYIFKLDGNNWVQQQKIVSSDRTTGDYFGLKVALNNNSFIIGARGNDYDAEGENSANDAGAVYFFGPANPMPVRLRSFNANNFGNRVNLNWATASEQNNKQFILSRSADGKNFTELTRIAGAGNSSTPKNYVYTDRSPLNGANYYKLEQVDGDGKINFVGVEVVNFKLSTSVASVYPNPALSEINLTIPEGFGKTVNASILDILGRTVYTEKIQLTQQQTAYKLNNKQLPAGQYMIKLVGNQKSESLKVFIK